MDDAVLSTRPVIAETNGITATFAEPMTHHQTLVPVVGWSADGVALIPSVQGKLLRAHEQSGFLYLSGVPMLYRGSTEETS